MQIRLFPEPLQASQLDQTIENFTAAVGWLVTEISSQASINNNLLYKLYYGQLRGRFRLSSQMAALCIRRITQSRRQAEQVLPVLPSFRLIPYDQRILRFKGIEHASLLTVEGRVSVPMLIAGYRQMNIDVGRGQSLLAKGEPDQWFLLTSVWPSIEAPTGLLRLIGSQPGVYLAEAPTEFEQLDMEVESIGAGLKRKNGRSALGASG